MIKIVHVIHFNLKFIIFLPPGRRAPPVAATVTGELNADPETNEEIELMQLSHVD